MLEHTYNSTLISCTSEMVWKKKKAYIQNWKAAQVAFGLFFFLLQIPNTKKDLWLLDLPYSYKCYVPKCNYIWPRFLCYLQVSQSVLGHPVQIKKKNKKQMLSGNERNKSVHISSQRWFHALQYCRINELTNPPVKQQLRFKLTDGLWIVNLYSAFIFDNTFCQTITLSIMITLFFSHFCYILNSM